MVPTADLQLAELLKQCEEEPIRIPGMVQSHGILITLRSSDFTILQISESIFDLCGVHPSELLHQPLSQLMDIKPVEKASKRLGDRTPRLLNPIPIEFEVNGKIRSFDGILHRIGRVLILELERHIPDDKAYGGFGGFYEAVREVTSKMMITDSLQEVMELACEELRKLTGFSRVLAYKFDGDWNGQVIAESREDHVQTLLHHHFPASDIPKQARDLYTANWLRLIPDVDYKPSNIVPPINPITDKPLDLSNSVLRSVSPVHLEYMRNMGQAASMSVSLLRGKQLWGLISCHHPEPKYLKYDVRVAAEFIGQMVSAQIVAREESTELDHKLQLKKLYDDLLRFGGGYSAVPEAFSANAATVLALADATGIAMNLGGVVTTLGRVPEPENLKTIIHWVEEGKAPIFATQNFNEVAGFNADDRSARGLLSITIPRQSTLDSIIWFRAAQRDQAKWAGDPAEKIVGADGKIHPRASFETWYDNSEGNAKKWLGPEYEAADELRRALIAMASAAHEAGVDNRAFRASLTSSVVRTADREGLHRSEPHAERTSDLQLIAHDSRLLLEGFSEFAVLFLDLKGRIQNWSLGARRLFGYESNEVLGKPLSMFFSEDDELSSRLQHIFDGIQTRGRWNEELWMYRDDKSSFWAKLLAAPVKSDDGSPIGYSVVLQDITQEKSDEEELKAVKASAEAANESKSAFLANISHEIRTPLGAVLGFSELMSQQNLSKEDRTELFGHVKRNGEQLTSLINDLLDISKIEAGKVEVEKIETDLQTLLHDLMQLFSTKAIDARVNLESLVVGKVPKFIWTDPTRLRQILVNLIGNALKFTPKGGSILLEVSMKSNGGGGNSLVLRVTDSGQGMSENQMLKLFQPFVQADVSTTRQFGGTGLGLFLSKRLARALGGDLSIESSQLDVGSTFVATIDPGDFDATSTFDRVDQSQRPKTQSMTGSEDLNGFKVLLVDDSADNRMLISTFLKKAGAEVETAENGKVGSDKAFEGDYDIVLMDVQMPVMDGNQAMSNLRSRGYPKPVVALTAHAMREEKAASLAAGFVDYLTKPVDRRNLIQRIREIVAHK